MNDNIIKANGTPVIGPHTVNKVIYLVLAFFLGGFGIHKFYEGRVGLGLLYLFTGGLCGIGVIVDLIMLILKPNPYYV